MIATSLYIGPALLLYLGAGVVLLADMVQGRRAATGFTALTFLGLAAFWTLLQMGVGAE